MSIKKFYHSKIVLISLIPIAVEIGNLLLTTPFIPAKFQGMLSLGVGILTIIFRATSNGAKITT